MFMMMELVVIVMVCGSAQGCVECAGLRQSSVTATRGQVCSTTSLLQQVLSAVGGNVDGKRALLILWRGQVQV